MERLLLRILDQMDRHPIIPVLLLVAFGVLYWRKRHQDKALLAASAPGQSQAAPAPTAAPAAVPQSGDQMSLPVLHWTQYDYLSVRDLLRSLVIFGASGSGKTSGSGKKIAEGIVRIPRSSGLILASKPEEKGDWEKIFAKAGRANDLLIFGPDSPLRFNMLDYVQESGGDAREITRAILAIGETLDQNSGQSRDKFWDQQNSRLIWSAVVIVGTAMGKVSAPALAKFITGAAQKPEELKSEEWQKGFHSKALQAALNKGRDPITKNNVRMALDYWLKEYPRMADKTRSSIVAGVQGILHVFNSGIVRELVSTTTTVSPGVFDYGKWVLVDTPISSEGASGAFLLAAWKYITQWSILKRHATANTPLCVIWADEAQKIATPSFDPAFLAECRSHRGCMLYLTQSSHAFYTRMKEGGEHEADSFLTNFYHKIFHALGDDKTAAYASSLIGRRLTTRYGGSMSPQDNTFDALFGESKFSGSFSQSIENIVENREFMQNMRTGGAENGYMVDAWVVRSGTPFSNGESYLKVAFSQR